MSLRPEPLGPIPTETARVARAAFPKGHPWARQTILQSRAWGARAEHRRANAEDNIDAVRGHLNTFHEGADNLASCLPTGVGQSRFHLGHERIEASQHELHVRTGCRLVGDP